MTHKQSMLGRIAAGAAICFGIALGGSALAQAPGCKADLAKFCPDAKPGGGQVAACLKQSESEVSAGCRARIAEAKKQQK